MAMSDDLTTRCLAEVERAMEAERHDEDACGACLCDGDKRLASRLARMLAAGLGDAAAIRVALHAILGEATRRASWGEQDLDVWVRQIQMAGTMRAVAAAQGGHMKRYVVTVDIVIYADSPEMARTEARQCLNTGKGHIHTYTIEEVWDPMTTRANEI